MRVAAVQAEPVWLDAEGGVEKVCRLIEEAAGRGCDLLGLPEVFVPGFPHTLFLNAPDPNWMLRYQKESIVVGSPLWHKVRLCAAKHRVFVVFGFSERDGSALYLSQSFFSRDGELLLHRRKIKPTSVERYLWGDGGSDSIQNVVVDNETGVRIGGLNCWEHMQPLLRYHSYENDVQIHVASWPYMPQSGPWFLDGNTCRDVQVGMLAIEGNAFAVISTQLMEQSGRGNSLMMMDKLGAAGDKPGVQAIMHGGGFAAILGPDGRRISEALSHDQEAMITADLDMSELDTHKGDKARFGDAHLAQDLISLNATKVELGKVSYSDDRHLKTLTERINGLVPEPFRYRQMV